MEISAQEWKIDNSVTCIDDTLLRLIRKVGQKFPDIKFKDMVECDAHCVRRVSYFKSKVAFTYIHFNSEGDIMSVNKSYMKDEVFNRYADEEGHIDTESTRYILMNDSWRSHARFLPVDEEELNQHSQRVKLGTFIKALCELVGFDTLSLFCDTLADEIKMMYANKYEVKVSDTPSDIYTMHSTFKSCMTECRRERFEIYDLVPSIKIAYIANGDVLRARALLHESTYYRKPIKLMDRIYYTDSMYLAAMKKWAVENGYWYKTKQSIDWNDFTDGQGRTKKFFSMRIPVGLDIYHKFIEVPYIDTFYKLLMEDGETYLGMPRAKGKHILDIRYASSRQIPYILKDMDAISCGNCGDLYRKHDIVSLIGYDRYAKVDREVIVCKTCAKSAMLCPRCGKHHVWKTPADSVRSLVSYMHTYDGNVYKQWGRVCAKCMEEVTTEERMKRAA